MLGRHVAKPFFCKKGKHVMNKNSRNGIRSTIANKKVDYFSVDDDFCDAFRSDFI